MKVIGLVSGGKDSCYALMEATKYGHQVVALANLQPSQDEMDSWMYQSVGHEAIEAYARAFGLPLFRAAIDGTSFYSLQRYLLDEGVAEQQTLHYAPRSSADEVESLYYLLSEIKSRMPDVEAVSSGAILSDYQRNRVESVCSRLGLVSLAYLWRRDQHELLSEMIDAGVHAVLIKRQHLGQSLGQLQPTLAKLALAYGINPCGEGGEYESFTLDCPLFHERIVIDETEIVEHSKDAIYMRIKRFHLEAKAGQQLQTPPITYLPRRTHNSLQYSIEALAPAAPTVPFLHFPSTSSTLPAGATLAEQVRDVIAKLKTQLSRSRLTMDDVRFAWVYVRDMKDFPLLNAEYGQHFVSQPPCRATVQLPWPVAESGDVRFEFMAERMTTRNVLHVQSISKWAAACIGPYAQAVADKTAHGAVVLSGQIGLNPATMQLASPELAGQCACALRNLGAILSAMATQLAHAMSLTVFVTNQSFIAPAAALIRPGLAMRAIETYLVVPMLPKGAMIELQIIAAKSAPVFGFEERVISNATIHMSISKTPGRCLVRLAMPAPTGSLSAAECAAFATSHFAARDALTSARLLYPLTLSPLADWVAAMSAVLRAPISLVPVECVRLEQSSADLMVLELNAISPVEEAPTDD